MSTITLKNTVYKNKLLLDFLDHSTTLSPFHNGSSLEIIDEHFMDIETSILSKGSFSECIGKPI